MECKNIPDPGFAGDDGSADPRLAASLAAWSANPSEAAETQLLALLADARLLVPIVAVLGESEPAADGLKREKTSDMAVATLELPDGRRGLPAFTGLQALHRWRADARPAPVPACKAVEAAWSAQAETVLIDLSGPVFYELSGAALRAVAERRACLPPLRDPEVAAALRAVLARHPAVRRAYLLPDGGDADARLVVVPASVVPASGVLSSGVPASGVAEEGMAGAVYELAADLAADPLLRIRVDHGLNVVAVPGYVSESAPPLYSRD
ncbi:SseB family protein [Streptomyces shenzhenensis]|uniref:SseB family protein n=1 Tax=Streptomyces shenzhenensis TaxID=943815 RepID=UPI003D93697C